ncbi:hypothetical protein [Streptomyces tailanensis]|uniref:hypothetical protein n=1 Tax=Streptomyces tailanensis TaxID=2569858 RepID=UPI00122DD624|nr:hypothetical protein [Streptomyces tailanensis]
MTPTALPIREPVPVGRAVLHAVRYEWRHLAGLTSTWILLGVCALLSLVSGVTLALSAAEGAAPRPDTVAVALQWDAVATQLPLLAFLLLPLSTGPVATELARGAARTSWLTVGSRSLSYGAKLLTGAAVAAVTVVAGALLTLLAGTLTLTLTGAPSPDWVEAGPPFVRFLLFMVCWPVVCTAVAVLLRNRVGTALALTIWPLLGERIAGMVLGQLPGLGSLGDWLPFAAARAGLAGYSEPADEDREFLTALAGSDLPVAAGMAVFVAFTLVVALAGAYAYHRRDAM